LVVKIAGTSSTGPVPPAQSPPRKGSLVSAEPGGKTGQPSVSPTPTRTRDMPPVKQFAPPN